MHVLITTDTVGGVWTYSRELVRELVRRGVRVTLVAFGQPTIQQSAWMRGLVGLEFFARDDRLEWMPDVTPQELEASAGWLAKVLSWVKPDLLHFNQFYYAGIDFDTIPKLLVHHSDVASWWWAVYGSAPPDDPWLTDYRRIVLKGLAGADAIVAPSNALAQEVQRIYSTEKRIRPIYNGLDPSQFNGRFEKEPLVLTVGRLWDKAKRIGILAPIAKRLHQMAEFHCIGASEPPCGTDRFEVDTRYLRPEGPLEASEVHARMARAAVYVATSVYEPFGLAPLEAAFSHCALVASDIPTFRELWEGAALFYTPSHVQEATQSIEALLTDEEQRQTLAADARRRALEAFNAERMAEDYLSLYRELV